MSQLPPHFNELRDLLIELTDGQLNDDQRDRLRELITTDDTAARYYADFMSLHAGLLFEPAEAPLASPLKPELSAATVRMSSTRLRVVPVALSLAAALLLSAAALAIYVFVVSTGQHIESRDSATPIATLIESTGTVSYGDDIAHEGGEYASGEFSVESGSAEFLLRSSVSVDLLGQTRMVMHNPMSATLIRGSASFNCPAGAEGFTVHLPNGAKVVDLGTRFTVKRDDRGVTRVTVAEGAVVVESADGLKIGLLAHEGAALAGDGSFLESGAARIVADYTDDFLSPTARPAWRYLLATDATIDRPASYTPSEDRTDPADTPGLGIYGRGILRSGEPDPDGRNDFSGANARQWVIAAYTFGPDQSGDAAIIRSSFRKAFADDPVDVRIYLNGRLVRSLRTTATTTLAQDFDTPLGHVWPGDTVYVAFSGGESDTANVVFRDRAFYHDYSIELSPGVPAQSTPDSLKRISDPKETSP